MAARAPCATSSRAIRAPEWYRLSVTRLGGRLRFTSTPASSSYGIASSLMFDSRRIIPSRTRPSASAMCFQIRGFSWSAS